MLHLCYGINWSWVFWLSCTRLRLNVDYEVDVKASGKVLRCDYLSILSWKVAES